MQRGAFSNGGTHPHLRFRPTGCPRSLCLHFCGPVILVSSEALTGIVRTFNQLDLVRLGTDSRIGSLSG